MVTRSLSFRQASVCVRVGMRVCARVTPSRAQSWIHVVFARTVDLR